MILRWALTTATFKSCGENINVRGGLDVATLKRQGAGYSYIEEVTLDMAV